MKTSTIENTEKFLLGGGEMGKLIRSMDWSKTALGPVETWPQSLRTSVSLCLSSTFPILIAWGPETIQIYNDSYRPICGAKHPESMGMNFRICWETALSVVGDPFTRGQKGEGTYINDQRMFLDRYGYLEEAFMTFSFAPIRDESGGVGGIFHPITETTVKMLGGRRTKALIDLGAAIGKAKNIHEIGCATVDKYQEYMLDIPFILLYQLNNETGMADLIASTGLSHSTSMAPIEIDIKADATQSWPLAKALCSGIMEEVTSLEQRFGSFSCEPYPETPQSAMILPIRISGQKSLFGFLITGVSSRRALDKDYLNFYDLLANTYNTAVSNVYAYAQEQQRAEALAAIDRAKTAFFSNVSHEFRTPLTLMLGPLEDLLKQNLELNIKQPVEAAHRNALRLLKLVNNLLDYSRVEAGRVQAAYQLLDLCELTIDLASSFRSIIEKAGMKFEVNCIPFHEAVYVDRHMWEKIVLNLLSNAFKYTLGGKIMVLLEQQGKFAVLKITDTGIGIPQKEIPHMFERFHRVQNAAGRTNEGTGIGLSLVNELVHLHHGDIAVESEEYVGSTFTVKIPTGKFHLPPEKIITDIRKGESKALRDAFLEEAINLLSDGSQLMLTSNHSHVQDISFDKDTHILIVDDNSDMRVYLTKLLAPYFHVTTALNGRDALSKLQNFIPDLVLSDIMMPVMDGKKMLSSIRENRETARLPVIFLSARAGEEARIDGLQAGADDYLVKPFSSNELLIKIQTQVRISKARGHAEQQLRSLVTNAPVAVAIYRGPNHVIELANNRMLEYWGRSAKETLNLPLFTAIPELASQGFGIITDKVYATGERFTSTEIPMNLFCFGKEEKMYFSLTIEALKNELGTITGMMAVAADVTGQVNARKELEKVTGTFKLAVDVAGMGIWRIDLATNNVMISEKAKIIHGFLFDVDYKLNDTIQVVIPEHKERVLQAVEEAIKSNGSFEMEYMINPIGGGKSKWLTSSGRVELDEYGHAVSVVGTILDITESKEDEIRKNNFIMMVSHELRTPLTSLGGYAQILSSVAKQNDDLFTEEKINKILLQVKKMTILINGFLNVSRLESGKLLLRKKDFNLKELIVEVIEESMVSFKYHEISCKAETLIVNADRDKVGTVLSNLVSNAIKYSPQGKFVQINALQTGADVTVSVKDEGMGIQSEDAEKLFERYYRVETESTRFISGFGIGLYLSSEIIKRHGGSIWVESEIGKGSTFYFTLPL